MERIGNVLYWLGCIIAALVAGINHRLVAGEAVAAVAKRLTLKIFNMANGGRDERFQPTHHVAKVGRGVKISV